MDATVGASGKNGLTSTQGETGRRHDVTGGGSALPAIRYCRVLLGAGRPLD